MKTTTWSRGIGHVSVVLFENKKSAAVSTKIYKTVKGAEAANERLRAICGDGYDNSHLPWNSTDPQTGERTVNYKRENLIRV